MKKKFLTFILAVCFIVPCAVLFSACSKEPPAPTLVTVEADVNDGYLSNYNADTKTFTYFYGDYIHFDEYSFNLTEIYSNGDELSVGYDKYSVNLPGEFSQATIPTGNYIIIVEYETYTFTYNVVVASQQITKPTSLTEDVFTYENENYVQTVNPTWFDDNVMEISGNEQVDAGTYPVTISLKEGYVWDDGTIEPITFDWVINKKSVTVPTYTNNQEFRYDMCPHFAQFSDYSGDFEFINESQIEIGDYKSYLRLNDIDNFQWSNGTSDDIVIDWSIIIGQLAKPTFVTNSLVLTCYGNFTAVEQDITSYGNVSGYYALDEFLTYSGNKGTDAGNYNATFNIKDKTRYQWEDGTNDSVIVPWSITPQILANDYIPSIYETEIEYKDGETIEPSITYSEYLFDVSGDLTATDVKTDGNYQIKFAMKSQYKQNFVFSSGNNDDIVKEWNIYPKAVNKPNVYKDDKEMEYNTAEQAFTFWEAQVTNYYRFEDHKATTVGNYTAKVYLSSSTNYKWAEDGKASTDYYEFDFVITPKKLDMPSTGTTNFKLTYTGVEQSLLDHIGGFNSKLMTIENYTATDVVTDLQTIIALKDDKNYCWSSLDTSNPITITWDIVPMEITPVITGVGDYYYNEQEQTVSIAGLEHFVGDFAKDLTITDNTRTEPGKQYVRLTFNSDNYKWNSNAVHWALDRECTMLWTIQKRLREKPDRDLTYNDSKFVYDGRTFAYQPEGFDDSYMVIANNSTPNAGNYVATITLKDAEHDQWADKTSDAIEFAWIVKPRVIAKPTDAIIDYTYKETNEIQTYFPDGFNETYMTISGNAEFNAGIHTATVKLNNPEGVRNILWVDDTADDITDNSTEDVTFNWEIKKLALSLGDVESGWHTVEDVYYRGESSYVFPYLIYNQYDTEKISYSKHYSVDGLEVMKEMKDSDVTRPGIYGIIVTFAIREEYANNYRLQTVEEGGYEGNRVICYFKICDSNLTFPSTFWEGGTEFNYDGEAHTPTYNLSAALDFLEEQGKTIKRDDVNITYEYYAYNEGSLGEQLSGAPTMPGTYCVKVNDGNAYISVEIPEFVFEIVGDAHTHILNEYGYCEECDLFTGNELEFTDGEFVSEEQDYEAGTYYFRVENLQEGSTYSITTINEIATITVYDVDTGEELMNEDGYITYGSSIYIVLNFTEDSSSDYLIITSL